jgi:cell fate (sporulation/competence/biofilm development) regulator YlbF (YheA/YmcA/DUF963 family)
MTDKDLTLNLAAENDELKSRVKELETSIAYVEKELQEYREVSALIRRDVDAKIQLSA